MALVDVVMPRLGESIMEATILRWYHKPGDSVRQDETLLDIATDKVDSEVPSTAAGILEEVLFQENDVVPVGAVIARIRTQEEGAPTDSGDNASAAAANQETQRDQSPIQQEEQDARPDEAVEDPAEQDTHALQQTSESAPEVADEPSSIPYQPSQQAVPASTSARFYSPLVINIAASEGISMSELEAIPGTGAEGRVTKKDILEYVERRKSSAPLPQEVPTTASTIDTKPAPEPVTQAVDMGSRITEQTSESIPHTRPEAYEHSNVEIVEMDRMRRLIADHMVRSKSTSAHVTSFAEADVTAIVQWRERVKASFEKRERENITFTPIFIEAIVKCLRKHPLLNSSVEGDRIIIRKDINIGMATALPSGNLIVPVIRDADQLSLVGLTKKVNRLARDARESRLKPDDIQGGTFTFTNVGSFGSLMGTPIINQPQVAILATGAIKKKPVVIESPDGDSIGIRHMMFVSMSYDHRIIDGALGGAFLRDVVKELETFDPSRSL